MPEIGLRRALGATSADVVRLVALQGASTIVAGVAAGLVVAAMTSRAIESLLVGVDGADSWSVIAPTAAIVVAALSAMFLPARRALRVDPMKALREEA